MIVLYLQRYHIVFIKKTVHRFKSNYRSIKYGLWIKIKTKTIYQNKNTPNKANTIGYNNDWMNKGVKINLRQNIPFNYYSVVRFIKTIGIPKKQ